MTMLQAYLKRIKFNEKPEVSADILRKLHLNHVLAVPFENQTVYQKEPVSLNVEDLFNKVITNNRGGYCFELNGLFAFLLEEIGFEVEYHLARVYRDGYAESGKTHRVNTVLLEGQRYLCDVGFGGNGLMEALLLEENTEVEQNGLIYRITSLDQETFQLETVSNDGVTPFYAFTLETCINADFEIANYFTATHPESFFRRVLISTRPTKNGRISLLDRELSIRSGQEKIVKAFNSVEEAWRYFDNYEEA
ncbi:MAG: N-hydroxyarylamine O-acetyltransferase [Eubacteriaceae bacterium]|nr:N-hydroxyarylamine O-acetyltransferase [Eubacteriaceae bacterium]